MIVNYMEQVVDEMLVTTINRYENICKCEKCIDDIKALTLNNLKPLYVVTEKGSIYSRIKELQPQFSADIINELTKSIEVVSKNPDHNVLVLSNK
jgi:competence protein ComFB